MSRTNICVQSQEYDRRVLKEERRVSPERRERRRKEDTIYKSQEERLPETSEVVIASQHPPIPRNPLAMGLRPSYAASARRVLQSSTRRLTKLQDSLSTLSSIYVNECFEDGQPCRVRGCPLNPTTRVSKQLSLTASR